MRHNMKTWSLPFGLCMWFEPKFGLGLSINFVPPKMGYEPFIVGQVLFFMFFVAIKSTDTGWVLDPMRDKFIRMTDSHRRAIADAEAKKNAELEQGITYDHSAFR